MVTGVMNCVAASLITTCTDAPSCISERANSATLKAAMPPDIASSIFLPCSEFMTLQP